MAQQTTERRQHWTWWIMTVLSFGVALYAVGFAFVGNEAFYEGRVPVIGLDAAATSIAVHAIVGAVALALGPFQFVSRIRRRRPRVHRRAGRVVVVAMLLTGLSGLFVAGFAQGGPSGRVGFAMLGVLTTATAATAWRQILRRDIDAHRNWMIRASTLILAAVTLRLQLPWLFALFDGDETAVFAVVGWTAWLPNLLFAEWWLRRPRTPAMAVGGTAPSNASSDA